MRSWRRSHAGSSQYRVGLDGRRGELTKRSDDGERTGQAGGSSYPQQMAATRLWQRLLVTTAIFAAAVLAGAAGFLPVPGGSLSYTQGASAGLVVAASDASLQSKQGADYICDGVADEVQINAAMASLPSGGGSVVLTEGTFNITAPITAMKDGIVIQGQGPTTLITTPNGTNVEYFILAYGDAWTIRDLRIDGNGDNQSSGGYGVFLGGTHGSVLNCYIDNTLDNAIAVSNSGVPDGASDCVIEGNYCGSVKARIASVIRLSDGASRCRVVNNYVYDLSNLNDGILVQPENDAVDIVDIVVEGNFIENGREGDTGIELRNHKAGKTIRDAVVRGNVIRNISGITWGISVSSCDNCVVDGNALENLGGYGIRLWDGSGFDKPDNNRIIVSSNSITNCGATSGPDNSRGIVIDAGDNVQITGNIQRGAKREGILVAGADKVLITNNVVSNNGQESPDVYSGVAVYKGEHTVITNNRIFDDQTTKTQRYGVLLDTGAAYSEVKDNKIWGNASGDVQDDGVDNAVGHPVVWDPDSPGPVIGDAVWRAPRLPQV